MQRRIRMAGEIVHVELVSSDFEKTRDFYGIIFGWDCQEAGVPDLPYMLWKAETGVAGGFRRPSEGDSPSPRIINYIRVDDIDSTCRAIEESGGAVAVPKTEISEEIGFMALFTDPDGNLLGLIQEPAK
jgi:predicted enzyme related to lactoylglutathione lyase